MTHAHEQVNVVYVWASFSYGEWLANYGNVTLSSPFIERERERER